MTALFRKPSGKIISSLLLLAIVSLALAPACAQTSAVETGGEPAPSPTEAPLPPGYVTYTDETRLFSIAYPGDWEPALSIIGQMEQAAKEAIGKINSGVNGSTLFLAGLPAGNGYSPVVTISVESVPTSSPDLVAELEIKGLKLLFSEYREISRSKTNIGGREATILEWEGVFASIPDKFHCLTIITVADKTAWMATCQVPGGDFTRWEKDFQVVLRSLRILA